MALHTIVQIGYRQFGEHLRQEHGEWRTLIKGSLELTLLSDDRIIIKETEDSYRIYGTPWHGNAEIASPLSVPLSRVYFLAHDGENRLTPVQGADATSRILVRSFPTFWDSEGMRYTLGLCERLNTRVPCYELGFVPDERVISMLKVWHEESTIYSAVCPFSSSIHSCQQV